MTKKIGLIGGTFNPIHNGHLFIAEEARHAFDLNELIFIPNKIPPHRGDFFLSDIEHRWNMLNLAIESNPFFTASRVEIDRDGISYSFDTVKYFSSQFPDDELFFITGIDAILNYTWYSFPELIGFLKGFIVFFRPGYSKKMIDDKFEITYPYCKDKLFTLQTLLLEISSTEIRKRIKNGISIKYLLPEKVEKYIFTNNLYI